MPRRFRSTDALFIPAVLAALKLVLEASVITRYGWFRDELCYVACSKHLAWGYVDQPPFSIALLAISRALLGDSLVALRIFPALAGAATVLITGLLARALGGGRFAQALACLGVVVSPVFLFVDHYFNMNAFDQMFWALGALLLVRALQDERARPGPWLTLGVVLGLGLLNKSGMIWFGGALAVGMVLTPHRRALRTPWPWAAGLLALVIFTPHVFWQIQNGWPTLEFMRNATQDKMVRTPFFAFWAQQVLVMSPAVFPVWAVGLGWLLASRVGRILGLMFIVVAALLIASGTSRPNYLTVAYPMLLAAGGVAFERLGAARRRGWVRPLLLGEVILLGLPIVPLGLPVLPPDRFASYLGTLGMRPRAQERTREGVMPQYYADMFGWEDLVRRVARVYHALSPEERAKCAILGENYGEAGAIDFFGPRYGLPAAISGHNNYWLWGTHGATCEVMILVGGSRDDPHADFQSVVLADTTSCQYCMPYEDGAPIWLCRGLNQPLSQRWPEVRGYR
jgi:hypothetical protein